MPLAFCTYYTPKRGTTEPNYLGSSQSGRPLDTGISVHLTGPLHTGIMDSWPGPTHRYTWVLVSPGLPVHTGILGACAHGLFVDICTVLAEQVRRASSGNDKLKNGIRYLHDYLNFMTILRSYGHQSAQQYAILSSQLGGPSPCLLRYATITYVLPMLIEKF